MRTAIVRSKTPQETTSPGTTSGARKRGKADALLHLQRTIGNQAVQRLMHPALPAGKTGADVFGGEQQPAETGHADATPAPLDERGLIDGEWSSTEEVHIFLDAGKMGTALVHYWGGKGGKGGQAAGQINAIAPVILSSGPAAAGGTARAWVQPGTGFTTVIRSYTGVLIGANADHFFTRRAAERADKHEEGHIALSDVHHHSKIVPLEYRVEKHTDEPNALSRGTTAAEAEKALETYLDWNATITAFRNADIADNRKNGAWDTKEVASPDFVKDHGPRTIGGVEYKHFWDTP
jgi:hypothetical protein